MIYLLLGSDDFSKKEYVKGLEAKERLEPAVFYDTDGIAALARTATEANLFGGRKIIFGYDFFSKNLVNEAVLEEISKNLNIIVFFEEKLDKRKTETKKILAHPKLKVLEFNTLVGAEFRKWVDARANLYGLKFGGRSFDLFLERIGFVGGSSFAGGGAATFGAPAYSLWQVDSELRKLAAFSGGAVGAAVEDKAAALTEENIRDLISENLDENIFAITNALGDKNKAAAIKALTEYIDRLPGDEKAKIISLSGLLAEQFRSILLIQGLAASGMGEPEMLAASGFASGKLFVYKKLGRNFSALAVRQALRKLEALDQEVKTTSGPANLQMLMIIEALLK
ncbi:MAG: polymerase delta subunit [Candidatus Doudnabacteria bacterium]|nr:polymerase delta subunit [Candidatus Doudnabacteria bacterium]